MEKKRKMTITIDNGNMCSLEGPLLVSSKLFEMYKVKHPNAWHIQMYQKDKYKWDGFIKYISESGRFRIGLLPKIYKSIIDMGISVNIIDKRNQKDVIPVIPDILGDKQLYPRQKVALKNLLNNKVGNIPFRICVGDFSVGFGKSILFASIHESFQRKLKTILLLSDSNLFNQFKKEFPPMLPDEDIKFIQGNNITFGNFNVATVQSLSRNIKSYSYSLSQMDIVLIDEADIIDNKTYKTVIEHLYNANIRIGLSGTIYMSNLKKDMVHNLNIMSFIGDKVDEVRLHEQISSGNATRVIVKMIPAQFKNYTGVKGPLDYPKEYRNIIINNIGAYKLSFTRTLFNATYNRFPMIIVCKFIDHCEKLYEYYREQNIKGNYGWKIEYVHHQTKNRDKILQRFRDGEIDILISTLIISRGQNFPRLQYLQNIASMNSREKSIQILGRLVRKYQGKNKTYLDDFIFPGQYLKRHGNHRKVYYQKEKLKVILVKSKRYSIPY